MGVDMTTPPTPSLLDAIVKELEALKSEKNGAYLRWNIVTLSEVEKCIRHLLSQPPTQKQVEVVANAMYAKYKNLEQDGEGWQQMARAAITAYRGDGR